MLGALRVPNAMRVTRDSPAVRKPARPFVTEHKSRKLPKHAALFDEGMVHGDHLPSRDINADVAELRDEGHDRRYEEALRAADNVFGGAKPSERTGAASGAPDEPARTVLSDLSYQDPLEVRLAAASLVRRGRKLGSKNRPKLAPPADAPAPVSAGPKARFEATGTAAETDRVRPLVQRRQRVGFLKRQQARLATKPGDRWKLKLPGR